METSPEDKIRFCNAIQQSPEWAIICDWIEREIKYADSEISSALRSQNYDRASHLNGMKEMAEKIKGAPGRIRKENTNFIKRIADFVRNGQIQTNGGH